MISCATCVVPSLQASLTDQKLISTLRGNTATTAPVSLPSISVQTVTICFSPTFLCTCIISKLFMAVMKLISNHSQEERRKHRRVLTTRSVVWRMKDILNVTFLQVFIFWLKQIFQHFSEVVQSSVRIMVSVFWLSSSDNMKEVEHSTLIKSQKTADCLDVQNFQEAYLNFWKSLDQT